MNLLVIVASAYAIVSLWTGGLFTGILLRDRYDSGMPVSLCTVLGSLGGILWPVILAANIAEKFLIAKCFAEK